jgi:cell division protein FtsQ
MVFKGRSKPAPAYTAVMNHYDMDFYVDQHGLKIPLSPNFTARVLVANGFIDELFTNHVDSLHTAAG